MLKNFVLLIIYYVRLKVLIDLSDQLNYANKDTINFFGIKNKSSLFDLAYFKPCENWNIGIMHDFLEGICQRNLNLFFHFCDKFDIISLSDLNDNVTYRQLIYDRIKI